MNTMALLCAYSRVYTTGQVPSVKLLRGGSQASAVAGLRSTLTGPTADTNSIHEFNQARDAFFSYVATTQSGVYDAVDVGQYPRLCLLNNEYPTNVDDCEGTNIGVANDDDEFLVLWNDSKVDADFAICGVRTPYVFKTGVDNYLVYSAIQPDNTKIAYNAPSVNQHTQREGFDDNRKDIVDRETQIQPQSVAKYSDREI
jgi:hypothetical protein